MAALFLFFQQNDSNPKCFSDLFSSFFIDRTKNFPGGWNRSMGEGEALFVGHSKRKAERFQAAQHCDVARRILRNFGKDDSASLAFPAGGDDPDVIVFDIFFFITHFGDDFSKTFLYIQSISFLFFDTRPFYHVCLLEKAIAPKWL